MEPTEKNNISISSHTYKHQTHTPNIYKILLKNPFAKYDFTLSLKTNSLLKINNIISPNRISIGWYCTYARTKLFI